MRGKADGVKSLPSTATKTIAESPAVRNERNVNSDFNRGGAGGQHEAQKEKIGFRIIRYPRDWDRDQNGTACANSIQPQPPRFAPAGLYRRRRRLQADRITSHPTSRFAWSTDTRMFPSCSFSFFERTSPNYLSASQTALNIRRYLISALYFSIYVLSPTTFFFSAEFQEQNHCKQNHCKITVHAHTLYALRSLGRRVSTFTCSSQFNSPYILCMPFSPWDRAHTFMYFKILVGL